MYRAQNKQPFQPNPEAVKRLQQIENAAKLLDNQFRFPGTNFRFGIDPLLGLIPFAGDLVSLGFQGMMLASMAKYGISRKVFILMALNITIDFIFGSIPILGNIFDFFFKSSERNLRLMKRHIHEGKHQGSGTGILIIVFLVFISIITFIGYLLYLLVDYLAEIISGWF